MSFRPLGDKVRKASKDHKCHWCGENIPKNSRYQWYCGADNGKFQDTKMHLECYDAMIAADFYADERFSWYDHDRGKTGGEG